MIEQATAHATSHDQGQVDTIGRVRGDRPLSRHTAPFSTEQAFIMSSARVANSPYKARNKGTSDHNPMQGKDLCRGKEGAGGGGRDESV